MQSTAQTYWVRLYAVERAGSHHFVYGYAVSAKAAPCAWKKSNLPVSGNAWKLNQFNCFADEVEIKRLQQAAEKGNITITVSAQSLRLQSSCLVHRPSVIAIPHEAHSADRPKSFSDDMAKMESHWELDKRVPLDRAFPSSSFDVEAAQVVEIELLERLESATGIKFSDEDAGRLGNFDVFHHLSGDFRLPDGLCCRSVKTESAGVERLSFLVWLEPPIQDFPDLLVGCRLFNGGGAFGRTCIMSEVRQYRRGENLNFIPQEPFSQFEVSVWSNQRLIGYRTCSILRGMSLNVHASGTTRRVRTKWSEGLPVDLRDLAATVRTGISQSSTVGSGDSDPWRETELTARQTVRTGFARKAAAMYFEADPKAQLESIEFLSNLILRPNVKRVTIADPFFDDIGVESLLVKIAHTKEVVVLASHTSSSGGKARLLACCEALRNELPRIVTIVNIESPGESSQQFHDRYVFIEMDEDSNTDSELWMLSNSFSSMAKNYPLVIAMLPPDVAADVAGYIRVLEQGKPPGKTSAIRTIIWSKASSIPSPRPIAQPTKGFEGSDTILTLLLSEQGLLSDWRVPEAALPTVIGALKKALLSDPSLRVQHLITIARWHYHGGPASSQYHFVGTELQWLAEAFKNMLASDARQGVQIEIEAIQSNMEMSDCLDKIWYSVNQMPFELRQSTNPALYFFAEALWASDPKALTEILDDTKNTALFGWLCMEGSGGSESQIQHLLAANSGFIKALGVVLLHDCCQRKAQTPGGDPVVILRTELITSKLPPYEAWLALVFTEARSTIPARPSPKLFEQSASAWCPEILSDEKLAQLTSLIGRAAPNRGIVVLARLAEVFPDPSWSKALHKWCIDQVLAKLPLKQPVAGQPGISIWCNAESILAASRSVWMVHRDCSFKWFNREIMKNLNLAGVIEPLLRTRNYTEWSDALDSVVLALWFGCAIAQEAPSVERRVEFANHTNPEMSKTLIKLGPEIWRSYVHKNEQLSCIIAFIGWSADCCDESGLVSIMRLALCDEVPSMWRLWLVTQSRKLILKHPDLVETLACNLSTGNSCHFDDVDDWGKRLYGRLEHWEKQITEELIRQPSKPGPHYPRQCGNEFDEIIRASRLRGIFHLIRTKLNQWHLNFQGAKRI